MVVAILSFQLLVVVPAVKNPASLPGFVGVVALYTPYAIAFIFMVTNTAHHIIIEKRRKILDKDIADLKEATPEALEEAIGDEQAAEIAAYRKKVAAQGRALLQAEIDAIQRWRADKRRAE